MAFILSGIVIVAINFSLNLHSTLEFQKTQGKKFTRLENDIDIGGRAAEMSPNIKAISGYLPKEIYNLLNAAAIFKLCNFFPPCGVFGTREY